jgi:hypothetical protein
MTNCSPGGRTPLNIDFPTIEGLPAQDGQEDRPRCLPGSPLPRGRVSTPLA